MANSEGKEFHRPWDVQTTVPLIISTDTEPAGRRNYPVIANVPANQVLSTDFLNPSASTNTM